VDPLAGLLTADKFIKVFVVGPRLVGDVDDR